MSEKLSGFRMPGEWEPQKSVWIAWPYNKKDWPGLYKFIPKVILEIIHTEPGLKGNTATNATKPATAETGAKINVPLFINEGDKIKVDTEKGTYIERVKE